MNGINVAKVKAIVIENKPSHFASTNDVMIACISLLSCSFRKVCDVITTFAHVFSTDCANYILRKLNCCYHYGTS